MELPNSRLKPSVESTLHSIRLHLEGRRPPLRVSLLSQPMNSENPATSAFRTLCSEPVGIPENRPSKVRPELEREKVDSLGGDPNGSKTDLSGSLAAEKAFLRKRRRRTVELGRQEARLEDGTDHLRSLSETREKTAWLGFERVLQAQAGRAARQPHQGDGPSQARSGLRFRPAEIASIHLYIPVERK